MNRFLIAIATMVFAAGAMLTPTAPAHAGMKGHLAVGLAIGALAVMAHENEGYERNRHGKKKSHHARRSAHKRKKVHVSKRSSSSTEQVAKAEPELAPVPEQKDTDALVHSENSSISTAALAPIEETASIDKAEPVNATEEGSEEDHKDAPKTANKLDCKKFFPAVGMTLTVPCE